MSFRLLGRPPLTDLLNMFCTSTSSSSFPIKRGWVKFTWNSLGVNISIFPLAVWVYPIIPNMHGPEEIFSWVNSDRPLGRISLFTPCFVHYCEQMCFNKYTVIPDEPSSTATYPPVWPKSGQDLQGRHSRGHSDPKLPACCLARNTQSGLCGKCPVVSPSKSFSSVAGLQVPVCMAEDSLS